MIKSIFLLGAALLLSTTINAQDEFEGEIRWGAQILLKRKEQGPFPIGTTNGSLYATKIKTSRLVHHPEITFQTFNLGSLGLHAEHILDLEYGEFDLDIESSFIYGDKVVFITSYIDKSASKRYYLLHEIESGSRFGKPIVLAELAWAKNKVLLTSKAIEARAESGQYSFRYVISDDKETMMVSYELPDTKGTQTLLLDKDLNEVSRGAIDIPYEEFTVIDAQLSNTGRFYTVGHEIEKGESGGLIKREINIPGKYHALIYDAVDQSIHDFDLDIGKKIVSVGIKLLPDEGFVAHGMYSNENAKGVSGAFFMKVDKDRNILFTELEEFEEDFITQDWTDRQKKKADKKKDKHPEKQAEPSLYSYTMHDMVIKDNGEMVLIAEQYYMYVTSHTYTDANGQSHTTYTYHYIYNDILLVNCSPEGEISWKNKVKKRQHSTNDGGYYSSFFTMTQGENIHMIYNDSEANMDETDEEDKAKKSVKKNRVAAIITVGVDGSMERHTFFDFNEDEARTLVPKMCEKMGEKEMLIYTKGPKNSRILGWVTLE
jgi:hypothetical protein